MLKAIPDCPAAGPPWAAGLSSSSAAAAGLLGVLGTAVAAGLAGTKVLAAGAVGELEAGGVVTTGMIVPEASDARLDDWRVAGDVGGCMYVGLAGGLFVTAGLLGPSPKPSRRPPNRPRGGRGGKRSFCAAQSRSSGEKESNVSSARGCNAASCVMRPALRLLLRLPPGLQLNVDGCLLELLLCCLSSPVILRQMLPKTLGKI